MVAAPRCSCSRTSVAIILSSFGLHMITLGMVKSFGVMYSEIRGHFGSGAAETSWIASLSSGLLLACGPIAGVLEKRFGCRVVAMVGSALIGVGLVTSAFVPSLYWLYLTYGVVTGVGYAMGHLIANVTVNIHFDKHRSLAIAVASTGEACGNIAIPWLTTMCQKYYGWRGTFLLLAGVGIQGLVFGAFIGNIGTSKGRAQKNQTTEDSISLKQQISTALKNRKFLLFALSGFCTSMAYFVPYLMLPDLITSKGLVSLDVEIVFTVAGISSVIGRLLVSLYIEVAHASRILTLSIALLIGGISTIGCAFLDDVWQYISYGVVLGVFIGTFGFLQSVITVDILGKQMVGIGFGLLTMFQGIAVIIGPPLAGLIADVTTNYTFTFVYAGILFCFGGFFSCLIQISNYCSVPTSGTGKTIDNDTMDNGHSNDVVVWNTQL